MEVDEATESECASDMVEEIAMVGNPPNDECTSEMLLKEISRVERRKNMVGRLARAIPRSEYVVEEIPTSIWLCSWAICLAYNSSAATYHQLSYFSSNSLSLILPTPPHPQQYLLNKQTKLEWPGPQRS
jgi:hypothetical protein